MKFLQRVVPQTLKIKLLIALFAIGFFPYLFILIYSHNLGEKKILDDTLTRHHTQMSQVKKHIASQFMHLKKEIEFLSSLDMMNDMIVDDIDKRIAYLLMKKEKDLSLNMRLFTIDNEYDTIASSHIDNSEFVYQYSLKKAKKNHQNWFFTKSSVMLFSPIISTIESDRKLGYLLCEYSFDNLSSFTIDLDGAKSMLYNFKTKKSIGELFDDKLSITQGVKGDYLTSKYLVLYQPFDGILSNWSLVYMVQKSVALAFLDEFIIFVWLLFGAGFIIIATTSWWISRQILKPIAQLSKATKSIIDTQDYTTQVSVKSQGEISKLADDFNAMVRETNNAFRVLEEENRVRLLRFVQLINIFNSLIQTQSEEACISKAIDELENLMPQHSFVFSLDYPKQKEIMMIYIKDFQKQSCDFYGVILLGEESRDIDPNEEKFYRSIATMIMLQLDQIRLIAQTQEVSQAKSTFISYMSHELRTPLHTILSSTQYLIAYEELSLPQQEKIATVESSAEYLLGMINDILDLAKIEAGKVTVTPTLQSSSDIEEMIEEIISMLEVLAQDVDITLHSSISTPISVITDSRFLKQIIINLLSNAIKFTPKGSIKLELSSSQNRFYIVIQDSGIGLSKGELESLFDNFSQIKHTNEITQKGSGLGLVISRKLARLFGGDITLSSRGRGEGARAIVELKRVK